MVKHKKKIAFKECLEDEFKKQDGGFNLFMRSKIRIEDSSDEESKAEGMINTGLGTSV